MSRCPRVLAAFGALILVPGLTAITAPAPAAAAPAGGGMASPGEAVMGLTNDKFTIDGSAGTTTRQAAPRAAAADTPPVGTVRNWPARDDALGQVTFKPYTLRGVGDKIEVWVANDTAFPAGDCRNAVAGTTTVTDAQVTSLVTEFDTNIYPKETTAFSTPPDRDGTHARIAGDYTGAGDRTVTLVDNVRDANFYNFPAASTYIAGFFSSSFNEALDRNVMTIDAFDWAHRTGAAPADQPTSDPCTSRPARPRLYEGTFAHEWQHLLQYYVDPNETTWVNEGLSDYAQTLVGYVDGTKTVNDPGFDSHLACFQGFGSVQTQYNPNPRDCGGPENSLNLWGESPNAAAVLADYGNAYELMLYLKDRFGAGFLTALHRDSARQGLVSLAALLKPRGERDVHTFLHDYQTMVLVDRIVEGRRGVTLGIPKRKATSASLSSTVNLANPQAYATPGAAPNGADYVPLGTGSKLRSLQFTGDATLPPTPLAWTVVSDDPDRPGNPVLFSGNADNLDNSAVTSVTVPAANPTLTFLAKYGAEEGYDYGYVIVSTDGGETYTAIPGDKTVTGPRGPAINGATNGFEPHTYDLSAYAGKQILLGFQYVTDGGVFEGGWLIDDVAVGGTTISDGSSLAPFDSITELNPTEVAGWNLRLVGLDTRHAIAYQRDFGTRSSIRLTAAQLLDLRLFPEVVAIVTYDEPTELVTQYAPYTLKVNGVTQPGGR
ncbi:choice-of-anchor J domain-containing protein [Actinoplanes sp. N902-109]|uniref:choice-of-anchor J domain-containing protein n=1 Tax=Actinoplanes sp. (strain N902-109) TaxID=649831 RepID=UPI0003294DEF|nr:choice-of-anchor J domain-containing protein [Actinoplanes sp. N902-109]AGL15202.1 peptidase M6 immune inhibitor A [Actinoplanes sp. N902-109]